MDENVAIKRAGAVVRYAKEKLVGVDRSSVNSERAFPGIVKLVIETQSGAVTHANVGAGDTVDVDIHLHLDDGCGDIYYKLKMRVESI